MNKYLKWGFLRIVVPVSWFASSVYLTRMAVDNVHIEFGLGALVLVCYAVILDFPRLKGKRARQS